MREGGQKRRQRRTRHNTQHQQQTTTINNSRIAIAIYATTMQPQRKHNNGIANTILRIMGVVTSTALLDGTCLRVGQCDASSKGWATLGSVTCPFAAMAAPPGVVDIVGSAEQLWICEGESCRASVPWFRVHRGHFFGKKAFSQSLLGHVSGNGKVYCCECMSWYGVERARRGPWMPGSG